MYNTDAFVFFSTAQVDRRSTATRTCLVKK